jgi:hypothetical protein
MQERWLVTVGTVRETIGTSQEKKLKPPRTDKRQDRFPVKKTNTCLEETKSCLERRGKFRRKRVISRESEVPDEEPQRGLRTEKDLPGDKQPDVGRRNPLKFRSKAMGYAVPFIDGRSRGDDLGPWNETTLRRGGTVRWKQRGHSTKPSSRPEMEESGLSLDCGERVSGHRGSVGLFP